MRGPCFYNAWPSSLQMEMLALGVGDVCYLLLSLWFWSSPYGRTHGQHCGLSCQPQWLPCHALRYHRLCSTSFNSFNKRRIVGEDGGGRSPPGCPGRANVTFLSCCSSHISVLWPSPAPASSRAHPSWERWAFLSQWDCGHCVWSNRIPGPLCCQPPWSHGVTGDRTLPV